MSKFSRLAFVAAFACVASSFSSQAHADPAGSSLWAGTWNSSFVVSSGGAVATNTLKFVVDSAGNHLQGRYSADGVDGSLWTFTTNQDPAYADSGIGDYAMSGDHRTLQGKWWDVMSGVNGGFVFDEYTGTDLSTCNWHGVSHTCTTSNPCFCGYWYTSSAPSTHYDWNGNLSSTAACF